METYLMAFTYGSVVMFNASEGMQKRLLRMCRKYAKNMASEDYSEGASLESRPKTHPCSIVATFCLAVRAALKHCVDCQQSRASRLLLPLLGSHHIIPHSCRVAWLVLVTGSFGLDRGVGFRS